MFDELENMFSKNGTKDESDQITQAIQDNAVDLLLECLCAWGSISPLRDRLRLHRLTINDEHEDLISQTRLFHEAEASFTHRMQQSAGNYLQYKSTTEILQDVDDLVHSANLPSGVTFDSLFDLETLMSVFQDKLEQMTEKPQKNQTRVVLLEIIAELHFMKGSYKESLYHFSASASYSDRSMSSTEDEAIASLFNSTENISEKVTGDRYRHILTMIETYDLYRALLKKSSVGRNDSKKVLPPIVSLINLVGLEISGNFIIQHCTLPFSKPSSSNSANENRSDLPINHVAAQLSAYPKLLYWFLQRIFTEKPEIYVQFPNTAVPPSSVTDLHRSHFNLHVDYADQSFDESAKLTSIPTFEQLRYESPFLIFLKVSFKALIVFVAVQSIHS